VTSPPPTSSLIVARGRCIPFDLSAGRWQEIARSEFPWEQEALAFIREGLPDHKPYRAWPNFEFIAEDGSVHEVDLLSLTPRGPLARQGPGALRRGARVPLRSARELSARPRRAARRPSAGRRRGRGAAGPAGYPRRAAELVHGRAWPRRAALDAPMARAGGRALEEAGIRAVSHSGKKTTCPSKSPGRLHSPHFPQVRPDISAPTAGGVRRS